uniref:Leucine-rich repeat-like protein n=1 Tax=Oryza sativa subsp. japonica TaxID=39947 RepID=Q6K8U4_ORYSJ|nr:leucine-rich repeat-like protein [Oryza sativa Japonica Group]
MACHLRLFPFTQLLVLVLYKIAAVGADPANAELSTKITQHSPLYNPQPQDFPNEELYRNYLVIQRFKKTITSDPKNITATWTGHDICGNTTYLGFYCAALPGRTKKPTVTVVIFNGYGLRAPKLEGFIDHLPDLALFHAASNDFGGDIPYLTGLAYNYKINVDSNLQIQDDFSRDMVGSHVTTKVHGYCVNLDLDITFHLRPGKDDKKGRSIPGATDSKALLLNYNHLSGPLPVNIGFSKLSYLALANNRLTGAIPPSILHLQDSLLEVLLLNNQLSGCLPHELGMLTKAAVFDAGMNQLTGPIPSSFSCLTSVEQLNLGGNRLYGEIPDRHPRGVPRRSCQRCGGAGGQGGQGLLQLRDVRHPARVSPAPRHGRTTCVHACSRGQLEASVSGWYLLLYSCVRLLCS